MCVCVWWTYVLACAPAKRCSMHTSKIKNIFIETWMIIKVTPRGQSYIINVTFNRKLQIFQDLLKRKRLFLLMFYIFIMWLLLLLGFLYSDFIRVWFIFSWTRNAVVWKLKRQPSLVQSPTRTASSNWCSRWHHLWRRYSKFYSKTLTNSFDI